MRSHAAPAIVMFAILLNGLGPSAGSGSTAPSGPVLELDSWTTSSHVDPQSAQFYTAETLVSARLSTGAITERFTGRPFWIEPLTGAGVRVAVIDTGLDTTHPDLTNRLVAWKDFVYGRSLPYDDDTHGTHVAGIIAAHGHFQWRPDHHYFPVGARGVAPGADLIVAKAMDREGDGDAGDVAEAILWAIDPNGDGDPSDGAHIINLSIGLETPPPSDGSGLLPDPFTLPTVRPRNADEERIVKAAIDRAVRSGTIVVVAAGNHEAGAAQSTVNFPGTLANVITVGAVDPDGQAAAFSNSGAPGSSKPDLVAPGVILSTFPTANDHEDSGRDGYVALGGTSMAAPMVAGAIALLLEGDPTLQARSFTEDRSVNTERVRAVLIASASSVGAGFNNVYGHGLLQVDEAAALVDKGDGPLNWSVLLFLLLLGGLGVLLVVRRRHSRAIGQRVAAARAEAMARSAPGGPPTRLMWANEADSSTPEPEPTPAAPPADKTDQPPAQRPPWLE